MALVNIAGEIKEIRQEITLLAKMRYKLSSQMRHFKEMQRLRMISARMRKFLERATPLLSYDAKSIDSFTLDEELNIAEALLSLIKNEGVLLRDFIKRGYLLQFSVISFGSCAKLYTILDKICKKLRIVHKIQAERKHKRAKQGP